VSGTFSGRQCPKKVPDTFSSPLVITAGLGMASARVALPGVKPFQLIQKPIAPGWGTKPYAASYAQSFPVLAKSHLDRILIGKPFTFGVGVRKEDHGAAAVKEVTNALLRPIISGRAAEDARYLALTHATLDLLKVLKLQINAAWSWALGDDPRQCKGNRDRQETQKQNDGPFQVSGVLFPASAAAFTGP
jgi:hypothetical protein